MCFYSLTPFGARKDKATKPLKDYDREGNENLDIPNLYEAFTTFCETKKATGHARGYELSTAATPMKDPPRQESSLASVVKAPYRAVAAALDSAKKSLW